MNKLSRIVQVKHRDLDEITLARAITGPMKQPPSVFCSPTSVVYVSLKNESRTSGSDGKSYRRYRSSIVRQHNSSIIGFIFLASLHPALSYGQTTAIKSSEAAQLQTESNDESSKDRPRKKPARSSGRSEENAVSSAKDAFGTAIGREALGLYGPGSVRGFSPTAAGNIRVEGLFFDQRGGLTGRVQSGSKILVGPSAQIDPFPAPTGIVDLSLRNSDPAGVSVLTSVGPYGSFGGEIDGRIKVGDDFFSLSAGAGASHNQFGNGGSADAVESGLIPRLKLGSHFSIYGFWGRVHVFDETAPPIYIPSDAILPRRIERGTYDGPRWAAANGFADNIGLIAKFDPGTWQIDLGIFRSLLSQRDSFANIVNDISTEGTGQRIVFANPPSRFASTSGELRVARVFVEGPRQHQLLASVRGRAVESRFGGSDVVDLGGAIIGDEVSPSEPTFEFSEQTFDAVDQITGGLSYGLQWSEIFQSRLGLQVVDYKKEISGPTSGDLERNSTDFLPNVTASLSVLRELLFYGSYTRGLEENGQTPDFAINRLNLLPALITSQVDLGALWQPVDHTNLIIGYFRVQKPYFNLDPINVFRRLGNQIHEGMEFSVTTNPLPQLTIVGGAVVQNPRVTTEIPIDGVGRSPVAQSKLIGQLNFYFVVPGLSGFSVDGTLNYTGGRQANVANTLTLEPFWNLSFGARYQFKLGSAPATLRISVQNVTNNFEWLPVGSGAYEPLDQRSIQAYTAIDF